jgi:hypothetical protein
MDKHEPGVFSAPMSDAPYAGLAGHTRFEAVHLVESDGSLASIPLCRGVNTSTHPELKVRALAGLLHRLDDGRELALSFVYHDPDARKFALVLPSSLAHTELKEWSKLMAELADDTQHAVPLYVRDATTVIGWSALERFSRAEFTEPAPAPRMAEERDDELRTREHLLQQRERDLAEQERALIELAEGLTTREGAQNRMQEELESLRAMLELREKELGERADDAGVAVAEPVLVPRGLANWTEVGVARVGENDATVMTDAPRAAVASLRHVVRESWMAPRSQPPPLPLRSRTRPPPLPLRGLRHAPPPLTGLRHADNERPRKRAYPTSAPPPLPNEPQAIAQDEDSEPAPEPEVAPPPYFAGQRAGQMALKLVADELWLFVHAEDARLPGLRRGIDLMLQYVELEGYPVVVVALVSPSQEAYALRLALDGYAEFDLRVVEHLSRSFRARVALYAGGQYSETLTVSTLREGVAQAISDRLAARPRERPALSASEAMVRVLHAPPPLWNDDLPFGPARREASSTATVLASVEQLASWLRPGKLAEATLTYCVPSDVIDATVRRVLRAAVAFGIALPDDVMQLAVEHRVARDQPSLLRSQLQAFRQRVEHGENDLGAAATRKNWQRLLQQAQAREIEVDDTTRALAALNSAPPPGQRSDAARAQRPLEAASPHELRALLDNDAERLEAIRELCARGHTSSIELVLGELERLSAPEVAIAVAHLLLFGEVAGDGLIGALRAPSDSVRQIAALALGRLKLRRALVPLVQRLEAEDSAMHLELARALGDFGVSGVRAVARAIPLSDRPDRLVLALAHLANHGAAKEVEKLENDTDPSTAQAARKAMARRSRMEWEDLAVREQRSLEDSDAAALLSQAFYAELAKVAI